jgi:protein Tex
MLTTETFFRISKEVGAPVSRVEATIALLEGGATVPFIARYRKEATGNLDEVKIESIEECRVYYTALEQRRQTILASIESQGKLTDELRQKILSCYSKGELEDLYLPYKPKRKTKASVALSLGLGPLADYVWEQTGSDPVGVYAERFISPPEPEPEAEAPVAEPLAEPVAETAIETAAAPEAAEVPVEVSGEPAEDVPAETASEASSEVVSEAASEPAPEMVSSSPEPAAEPVKVEAPRPEAPKPAPKLRINTVEEAIDGALHILAERISENAGFRKQLRDKLMLEGVVRAAALPGKESEKTKYEMYYKFEETVPKIPSHRILAIRRGTRENVLSYSIETDSEKFVAGLLPQVIHESSSQFAPFLERAVRDGYERLMLPSIRNEARSALRERAEMEAIQVFEDNLKTLLLSPPAGPIGVIGIDPGIRTGCKAAVVDQAGKFLESQVLKLSDPGKDLEGAEKILTDLVQKHGVRAITVGNGTGSREAEAFVRSVVQKNSFDLFVLVVNEAGASVYSASRRAREEFPDQDVTVRGAISIARRLQDPLAELVKIEPRSIGVGQYQHDVDQKKLKHSLEGAVGSCVNRVGVDLNTASEDLLKYVSGINAKLALTIIARRQQSGGFRSRTQLKEIEGFGDKTFEQAAGFLRIKDGENPLDRTGVHPESYPIVEKIASSLGASIEELIGNSERVSTADFRALEGEAGRFTLTDIREELLRPGRDPRDKFVAPRFRDDVKEVVDLQEGMELEGRVTNVTNFGAFVDLGVHQDGLVHISELSHRYVQDAREAVKVGDVVKVKVIGVDQTMKRISLSMKALLPKPPRPPRRKKRKAPPPQVAAAPPLAAGASSAAAPAGERRPPRETPPPRKLRPEGGPRPEGKPRPPRPQKPKVEVTTPAPAQTMEQMIQALQAKFSGMK